MSLVLLFSMDTSRLRVRLADDFAYESTLRLLGDLVEQARIDSIKDAETRVHTLCTRLFSRYVLNFVRSRLTDTSFEPFAHLDLSYGPQGKPEMAVGGKTLQFNASNSNDVSVVIVEISEQNTPIGVDLSHSKQRVSPTEYMEQFGPMFSEEERETIGEMDVREGYLAFNRLWTAKEAYTKYAGVGLNVDLSKIGITLKGLSIDNFSRSYTNENTPQHSFTRLKLDCMPEEVQPETLSWSSMGIEVPPDWAGAGSLRCYSAVLRETALPVYVTFVSESDAHIYAWNVDLDRVVT